MEDHVEMMHCVQGKCSSSVVVVEDSSSCRGSLMTRGMDGVTSKEMTLQAIKGSLSEDQIVQASLNEDICRVTMETTLAQDELASVEKESIQYQSLIDVCISEKQSLMAKICHQNELLERDKDDYHKYKQRIDDYVKESQVVEESSPTYSQLKDMEKTIQQSKQRRDGYLSGDGLKVLTGDKLQEIQRMIESVISLEGEGEDEKMSLERELGDLNMDVDRLKSDWSVCQKRKNAQLTRLRRQLHEAQCRSRQWAEELTRLTSCIQKLKRKIEE